ncbi:MAG: type IV pili twitching motility protein PilT [Candidatus Buchananbacteria bacterium RIFCSPHIGHO2_02_FULL_38_8]|uniref:Type IV pili twitching motility protein PilT n=2 Tax=Candidatus Buchananiibacteriota TaxID=1817903 RepID=A0A1G1XTN9_9BACT|nr:MAG: type IV pili twitching motility protein PilT [Candidatus Buchananbacteria bacterium RIFCSPHIGHO2_01_FULL_39_8]OGY46978.1 MAG: type IV pili twitching motility protein PilT [Candidatus Buchananbacteria bacterium RIFCSPHIGHO2_02_FULL_38_8]
MNIDDLFKIAVEKKASDLHIIVGMPPVLRIDGNLQEIKGQPKLTNKVSQDLIYPILTEEQKKIFINKKELDLSYEIKSGYRFRVNLHWEKNNIGLVARVISSEIPTMEDVAMPEIVYKLLDLHQGLILVTGPTGCGKSTTLAAMINHVNKNSSKNIITLEDPIEFLFKSEKSIVKQRQLHTDMVSFKSALIHVLRQDPNVIMVGEMRDLETIANTVTIAETGHLVLATLHTHNSAQTIDRIIDIFPPHQQQQIRLQVSMTLKGIISQQLIPKKGGGRIATREILINTPAISNLIRENKIAQIKTVIQTSADEGMITMDQDLINMYNEGVIDKETAQAHMTHPEMLR